MQLVWTKESEIPVSQELFQNIDNAILIGQEYTIQKNNVSPDQVARRTSRSQARGPLCLDLHMYRVPLSIQT